MQLPFTKLQKKWFEKHLLIGWQEWCSLPQLHLPAVKAKIDTGAQTSALHAFDIERFSFQDRDFVRFKVHPVQANRSIIRECTSELVDIRDVMSSNGHKEKRFVIKTLLQLGDKEWEIEITLSNRDPLRFRMLLGREALHGKVIIDPTKTSYQKKIKKREVFQLYDVAL
ncbi:MAG: ATP-dependent zinc protease [Gammaproteobacteria bacterium]